jgi:uracil-DNA glycosylase
MKTVATSALNDETRFIRKLADLQQNMHKHGFLLLNATLVFRDNVAPVKDGKSWQPFLQAIFSSFWATVFGISAIPCLWGKLQNS